MKILRLIFTTALLLTTTMVANAQLRDVTTVNPMSPSRQGYNMLVYEYESVDIRPEFPRGERGMSNFIN